MPSKTKSNTLYAIGIIWIIIHSVHSSNIICDDTLSNFTTTSCANFTCSSTEECSFSCSGKSCNQQTIQCPTSNQCIINCQTPDSCHNTTVNASSSSKLFINCNSKDSCSKIQLFCPITTSSQNSQNNEEKQCVINFNDYSQTEMDIHTINGWDDIMFNNYTKSNLSGSMFCVDPQTPSISDCPFNIPTSSSNLQCNTDHVCNSDTLISTTTKLVPL